MFTNFWSGARCYLFYLVGCQIFLHLYAKLFWILYIMTHVSGFPFLLVDTGNVTDLVWALFLYSQVVLSQKVLVSTLDALGHLCRSSVFLLCVFCPLWYSFLWIGPLWPSQSSSCLFNSERQLYFTCIHLSCVDVCKLQVISLGNCSMFLVFSL